MKDMKFSSASPKCREFLIQCSSILEKRKRDVLRGQKYILQGNTYKTFTVEELIRETDLQWYPLTNGRSQQLPTREMVDRIASYLSCNQAERYNLLLTADHPWIELGVDDEAHQKTLQAYRVIGKTLAQPYFIINRSWDVLDWNAQAINLFHIENQTDLSKWRKANHNFLWLIFDKSLPLRPALEAASSTAWHKMSWRYVADFKIDNQLYIKQQWYLELIKRLSFLPDFTSIYEDANPTDQTDGTRHIARFRHSDPQFDGDLRVQSFFINISIDYPRLLVFMPNDAQTTILFKALGFNVAA